MVRQKRGHRNAVILYIPVAVAIHHC